MAIRQADDRLPSWQAMDSGRLLLLAAVGMMVVAAVAHTTAARVTQPQTAIAFGSVIAIGELLRLRQQGGRDAAPIATAAALAYALLLRVGQLPGSHPVPHIAALHREGWRLPERAAAPADRQTVTAQDHDDPTAPLRVIESL